MLYSVSFCWATKWNSCMYTYIPFLLNLLLPFSVPLPRSSRSTQLSSWCRIAASHWLFTHHSVHMSNLLSQFVSPRPLPFPTPCHVHISVLFSSLFLPCKQAHVTIFLHSRFMLCCTILVFVFLTDFTLWHTLDLSTSQMTQFFSFLWLSNIPSCMCVYTPIYMYIYIYTSHFYPFICLMHI